MSEDLFQKLDELSESDIYPFHMPGHKRRDIQRLISENIGFSFKNDEDSDKNFERFDENRFYLEKYDITEIDGFDNLHHAEGILKELNERIARLYGIKNARLLVGGSTTGVLSSVFAVVKPGDTILIGRNCHMAVFHAALVSKVKVRFLYPDRTGKISAESVKNAFEKYSNIKAVVITDPTYEGIKSDIEEIAKIIHTFGSKLIVDAAHGAHLIKKLYAERDIEEEKKDIGLNDEIQFPNHPINDGADIAISSLHKTLPAITGTAEILISEDLSNKVIKRIDNAIDIFETSSPSYLMMVSISNCVKYLEDKGKNAYSKYKKRLKYFYEKTKNICFPRVLSPANRDPSKIVLLSGDEFSGYRLMGILREEYHLELEEASDNYCLAMTSIMDTDEGFERLIFAIRELNDRFTDKKVAKEINILPDFESMDSVNFDFGEDKKDVKPDFENKKSSIDVLEKGTYDFSKYYFSENKKVKLIESEGKKAADFVEIYPPGVPFIYPGLEITRKMIGYINRQKNEGAEVLGLDDGEYVEIIE